MGIEAIHFIKASAVGIIEGLTEFLPISSTAHILMFGRLIEFNSDENRVFEVVIQLGAILAVCWIYRHQLMNIIQGLYHRDKTSWLITRNVTVAFLPAAVIGLLLAKHIKSLFHHPMIFAVTLFLGGLIILWVERKPQSNSRVHDIQDLSLIQALSIGFIQTIAMIPGTSRSGATIIGSMCLGVNRQTATQFSFFLAIPTMLGASVYDLYKHIHVLTSSDWMTIGVGFIAAFISALLVVQALIKFVAQHTFKVFAWYRIVLSIIIAGTLLLIN